MTLPKLADYRNDLFATHEDVGAALRYVNDVCSAAPDSSASIAMRTIAHIILNTAITMHKDEIAAIVQRGAELAAQRNDPLTEQIKAMTRVIVRAEMINMDEAISNMTNSISGLVKIAVESAVGDKTPELVNECIEHMKEWVDENLDSKMDDWAEQNIDLADAVETHMNNEIDWDEIVGDKVNDKIRSYFRNNSFTIEEN
jgi:hypothetical protein